MERMVISILGGVASGQGLEDALIRSPTLLCQIDEFDTVLETLKSTKNTNAATEALWSMLLTLFSASGSTHTTRMKAASSKGNDGGIPIYQPSVSLYASAIPARIIPKFLSIYSKLINQAPFRQTYWFRSVLSYRLP
jgi:hypothetical protein